MASPTEYNKKSSKTNGWSPADFGLGATQFGKLLTDAVKEFQEEFGLLVDGFCGPLTARRLELIKHDYDSDDSAPLPPGRDSILVGGEQLPILWPHVITPDEPGALVLTKGFSKKTRSGKGAVIHWPVTYEPKQTIRVLNKRGVGTHFEIGPPIEPDARVAIHQYCDVKYRAFHASTANNFVGIDVSSPVYAKNHVLAKLKQLGHSERPIISGLKINGWKPPPIIGFHENQVNALVALLAALHVHAGVVLEAPAFTGNPRMLRRINSKAEMVNGVYHHAEVDYPRKRKDGSVRASGKWDTVGIDLYDVVKRAKLLAENMEVQ